MAYKFYRRPEESWHPDSFREIVYDAIYHSDPDFEEDGVAGNRLDENEMWCKPSDLIARCFEVKEMLDCEEVDIFNLSAFKNQSWLFGLNVWPTAYAYQGDHEEIDCRTLEIWTKFNSSCDMKPRDMSAIERIGLAYMFDHEFDCDESSHFMLQQLHVIFHTKDGLENDLTIRAGWYER